MFKLLAYHDFPADAAGELRRGGVEIKRGTNPTERQICADIVDCDALAAVEQPENGFNKAIIDAGKQLQLIARRGVGYETIDVDYAARNGVYVTNTPGINHISVAEAAVMLMLECARNAQKVDERFRRERGDYPFFTSDPASRGFELRGLTLGLIGCGRIGGAIAHIAGNGFGMRVLGYDPYAAALPAPIERRSSREDVFREADFVSLHAKVTPETKGMFGAKQFAMMKPEAYFINTARGALVVQEDLVAALKARRIAGAALDVYDREPQYDDSPLLDLDNVVLTPHIGGATKDGIKHQSRLILDNVKAYLDGAAGAAAADPGAVGGDGFEDVDASVLLGDDFGFAGDDAAGGDGVAGGVLDGGVGAGGDGEVVAFADFEVGYGAVGVEGNFAELVDGGYVEVVVILCE